MKFLLILMALLCQATQVLAAAVDVDRQAITIALSQEPPNLDSSKTTDLVSFFVIGHVNEGLVRYDRRGQLAPAVAESWEASGNTLTFRLRRDARWSDGSAVVADDFVYAWRRLNDPDNASPYASIAYPVLNAEAIQKGEKPLDSLGIRAIDSHTLEVRLERPCGYCVSLTAHAAFYPIKQAFAERKGALYGAEPEHLLYNGPFMLTSWTHGASLKMVKNPGYWNRDEITLNEIDVGYITEENRARLNLFRDNAIALAKLGADTVADAASDGLRMRTFASGGLAFLRLNVREDRLFRDQRLRQAFQLIFDPEVFVNKVIGIPGYRPAYSLFPAWLPGADSSFIEEHPPARQAYDPAKARALVDQVRAANGGEVPALTILTVTSPTGARIAEYFQGIARQHLGLEVRVDQQTFKQYLDKTITGDFDMALSSWYPDFNDVVTYADLLASWNGNNRGKYDNPEYDRWLKVLQSSNDQQERMAAAAELQRIIFTDVPVIPMAETGSAYVQHPQLKGVVRRVLGADPDYTRARVVP
ncbi:MAG: peptide ABC transporter substrate-binding protein [Pseudomonadales bacterium]|nr:peptide ABC transporter substrate-binding protein [Pseudomonadales bacterium]